MQQPIKYPAVSHVVMLYGAEISEEHGEVFRSSQTMQARLLRRTKVMKELSSRKKIVESEHEPLKITSMTESGVDRGSTWVAIAKTCPKANYSATFGPASVIVQPTRRIKPLVSSPLRPFCILTAQLFRQAYRECNLEWSRNQNSARN